MKCKFFMFALVPVKFYGFGMDQVHYPFNKATRTVQSFGLPRKKPAVTPPDIRRQLLRLILQYLRQKANNPWVQPYR